MAMDEERVQAFVSRLRHVLAADLPLDAAGSKALALALLVVQAQEAEAGNKAPDLDDVLRMTPTERIANMERQLRLVRQLQHAARTQQFRR